LPSTSVKSASPVTSAQAGAVAGAVATIQQTGYAIGVAVTGVVYFAHADSSVGHAFELSLVELALLGAVLVVATRLLPAGRRAGAEPAAAVGGA
jgi:hypothetical protein